MIKVPSRLTDPIFDENLKRGTVIKTLLNCSDGTQRPHYFITISKLVEKNPLIFIIATSKTAFYDKNPSFNTDIIRIMSGELSYFNRDTTIIDCRKLEKVNKEELKEHFQNNVLEFVGELPLKYLEKIDSMVRRTRHISLNDKLLILGEPPAT